MFACLCAAELSCGGERMTFGSWVSPSIICVLEIKLHSSDLVAQAFTCWTISPALLFSARTCSGVSWAGRHAGTLLNHLHWMRYTWLWRFCIETSIVVMCCSLSWITGLSWVTLKTCILGHCCSVEISYPYFLNSWEAVSIVIQADPLGHRRRTGLAILKQITNHWPLMHLTVAGLMSPRGPQTIDGLASLS